MMVYQQCWSSAVISPQSSPFKSLDNFQNSLFHRAEATCNSSSSGNIIFYKGNTAEIEILPSSIKLRCHGCLSVSSKRVHISPTAMMRFREMTRETKIIIIFTSDMLIFTTPFLVESFLSNKAETEHFISLNKIRKYLSRI